jgi:hypothetical protein
MFPRFDECRMYTPSPSLFGVYDMPTDPNKPVVSDCQNTYSYNFRRGNWEVKMEEISFGNKIGEGAMAAIFKAKLRSGFLTQTH